MEEERQTEISKDLLDLGVWSQNPAGQVMWQLGVAT